MTPPRYSVPSARPIQIQSVLMEHRSLWISILSSFSLTCWAISSAEILFAITLAALLVTLLAVACWFDICSFRIPNWVTYPTICWAIGINTLASSATSTASWQLPAHTFGTVGSRASLAGAGLCFLVMFVVYSISGRGAGDVKLATAIGALAGVSAGISVLIWTHLIAGVVSLTLFVWRVGLLRMATTLLRATGHLVLPQRIGPLNASQAKIMSRPIPMACFFALGTVATYFIKVLP